MAEGKVAWRLLKMPEIAVRLPNAIVHMGILRPPEHPGNENPQDALVPEPEAPHEQRPSSHRLPGPRIASGAPRQSGRDRPEHLRPCQLCGPADSDRGCRRPCHFPRPRQGAQPRFRVGPEGPPAPWQAISCSSSHRPQRNSRHWLRKTANASLPRFTASRSSHAPRGARNSRVTTYTACAREITASFIPSTTPIFWLSSSPSVIVVRSIADFVRRTLRLSCGARAPQPLRHRPPARRQLQPVVRWPKLSSFPQSLSKPAPARSD